MSSAGCVKNARISSVSSSTDTPVKAHCSEPAGSASAKSVPSVSAKQAARQAARHAGRLASGFPVTLAALPSSGPAIPAAQFPCFLYTARCIRFAYLDGRDPYTHQDYSHRRQWMLEHLSLLMKVFCVDVVGLKIECDRYRMILSCNEREAQTLSNHEVINRWRMLYKGPKAMDRYVAGDSLTREDREVVAATADLWRSYLINTGRFLGHLHQTIAHQANEEDGCKGRFWEGRSACRSILNQGSLDTLLAELDA
ncbi:MAG: hypothetical protein KTR32_14040 [Granulosicoccus sp.]|nr:hypothetical protein [Granulosicoccus sp.]